VAAARAAGTNINAVHKLHADGDAFHYETQIEQEMAARGISDGRNYVHRRMGAYSGRTVKTHPRMLDLTHANNALRAQRDEQKAEHRERQLRKLSRSRLSVFFKSPANAGVAVAMRPQTQTRAMQRQREQMQNQKAKMASLAPAAKAKLNRWRRLRSRQAPMSQDKRMQRLRDKQNNPFAVAARNAKRALSTWQGQGKASAGVRNPFTKKQRELSAGEKQFREQTAAEREYASASDISANSASASLSLSSSRKFQNEDKRAPGFVAPTRSQLFVDNGEPMIDTRGSQRR
jgi:hypothetical protein